MIKKLTRHYHKSIHLKKILIGTILLLGWFFVTLGSLHAETIPFEDNLSSIFWWLDTGYYSNTYFKFGGNDFVGIVFRQGTELLSTPETITINGWAQAITCTEKLRWIYYNNQRGWIIWPLDTGNLTTLQTSLSASGYDDMSMQHGFYTNCSALSWGYIPIANEVYGQIDHTLSGVGDFHMFAGVSYDFTNNAISWAVFDHTLAILTWVHTGYIFDTNWGIAELSMNLPRCAGFSITPTSFSEWTTTSFLCQGNSIAGYGLNIFSGGTQSMYDVLTSNTSQTQLRTTWNYLPIGNYTAQCVILFSGGVWGIPCGSGISFSVTSSWSLPPSGSGCDTDFQWEISFSPRSSWQIITNPSLGTYYTNITGIVIHYAATEPNTTVISWNFISSPIISLYTWTDIFTDIVTENVFLTNNNSWNTISSTFTVTDISWSCTYTDADKRILVDTIAPSIPTVTTPISGSSLCPSTLMTVNRSGSNDTGSLMSHYVYEIYSNTWMTTRVLSGSVPSTITTTQLNISALPLGTYYLRIIAVDAIGLQSYSPVVRFTTLSSYCSAWTGIMIVSPVISITNADLNTVYRSNPIYILGLTWPSLLSISKWILLINNNELRSTGMVTSLDTVYIELISSNDYDETITSELSILWHTWTFSVTTKDNNCNLSSIEKLLIQNIYAEIKEEYNNDISKFSEFLNTFQNMVEDESEVSASCTLEYLLELINDDFDTEGIDTKNHITPNCKEYLIGYDIVERAYYSPDMMNIYYFINRESLIRHLDYYNPGDCHINTYGTNYRSADDDPMLHIAPNGKVYHLIGQYGWYSAKEFMTAKYFDSLQSIKTYIDLRNPAKEIWRHTIDTTFIPLVYAAPNGKEYKIYKTDRWYMSYKLMKVKYFTTLSELKSYIDKNNPSQR